MLPNSFLGYFTILATLWIAYIIYIFISYVLKMRKIGNAVNQFPMNPKHWLLGHMDKFPGPGVDGLAYFHEMVQMFPRCAGFWVGNFLRPNVMVYHPETVKLILKRAGPKPLNTGGYRFVDKWLGGGLLLSSGTKWHRNRRLLTNVFHFDALKHYISIDNKATDVFIEKLSSLAKSQEYFEVSEMSSQLSFDVFVRCAFSYESNVQKIGENFPYIKVVNELGKLAIERYLKPLYYFDFIYLMTKDGRTSRKNTQYVHQVANQFIKERKQLIQEDDDSTKVKFDFLDILLRAKDESGEGLTDEEIRQEVDNFMFAGHDTTSSAIAWTLYSMASHPQYQKLCQEEIDGVLDGRLDDTLNCDDLQRLPYLTMCIKESLRIHGIVPIIERELDQPLVIDGIELPVGTVITINLYCLHNNPHVWNEPTKYDPERFSFENTKNMDPFAFVPFSAGPRNCIGQSLGMDEVKVVMAKVLRKFSIECDPNRKPEKLLSVVMKASNGIYLKVTERND